MASISSIELDHGELQKGHKGAFAHPFNTAISPVLIFGAASRTRTCMTISQRGLSPLRLPFRHSRMVPLAGFEPASLSGVAFETTAYAFRHKGVIGAEGETRTRTPLGTSF